MTQESNKDKASAISARGATVRIKALLTVHDRKEETLACLAELFSQERSDRLRLAAALVDDRCTDGTAAEVSDRFPEVEILPGDGSLFWCGGMRLAQDHVLADPGDVDYLLWLNDDTRLLPGSLLELVDCHQALTTKDRAASIVVGSTRDPKSRELSYGGFRRLWPLPFLTRVRPGSRPRRCSTMNGNCVLIPIAVARRLGSLDPRLTHLRGDIEYGLRARRQGVEVWLAPGTHGVCAANPIGRWRDSSLSLSERLASLAEPKYGMSEKSLVARRYYGPLWFLSPLAVYGYILATHLWSRLGRLLRAS